MKCAVGSRENTRRGCNVTTGALRAANGVAATALLVGALLVGPDALAQTGTAAPPQSSSTPASAPSAKTSGAAHGAKKAGDKAPDAAATDEKSKASYAIGVSIGSELVRSKITADSISTDRIAAGMRDALGGKVQMSGEYQATIMAFLKSGRDKQAAPNHAAAETFLAENKKKKDIVTTASGLQYKVVNAGSGDSPKPGDMVTVNYRGTLLNGTEFDSSAKHGGPATFASNQVIPGWQEALTLMKPGAKYQLFIPPNLAYDLESPPTIPPGSMLIFDVELVSVKPAAAAAGSAVPHPQIQAPAQPADKSQPQKK
jgi:FKBP-type peptidyl-prolyl cis-trans isomerase